MIEKDLLEKAVAFINRRLQDPSREIDFCECILRHEDVEPEEMTNVEFVEEIVEESDNDPGLLIDEDCEEENSAYVIDGEIFIVNEKIKYGVPLEDINSIRLFRNKIVFLLTIGFFAVSWDNEADLQRLIDWFHSCPTFGE